MTFLLHCLHNCKFCFFCFCSTNVACVFRTFHFPVLCDRILNVSGKFLIDFVDLWIDLTQKELPELLFQWK